MQKLLILESLEFLIMGINKPSIYKSTIIIEAINIALTAFNFIKIIFLLILETIQQSYKVYDLYLVDISIYHPMHP